MSFFSVVIPLFNKENFISETIESLLNQSFTDFEVIIINDGSTDQSLNVIQPLIDHRFKFIHQNNKGVSHARNLGINQSKGKYIVLLDADDFWYPNHLFELKHLISTFPNAGLFCNNYEIDYDRKLVLKAVFNFNYNSKPLLIKDYFKGSIINSIAWTSSVAFNRMNFEKIGQFNLKLKTGQDIDLWIRFALHFEVAFNPIITMRYHNYNDGLSKIEYNNDRYTLINNFNKEEKNNPSLKLYLDINRFAVALRSKMNNETNLYEKLKNEINFNNLNFKQKLLLNSPVRLVKLLKRIQKFLISKNMYTSAYK